MFAPKLSVLVGWGVLIGVVILSLGVFGPALTASLGPQEPAADPESLQQPQTLPTQGPLPPGAMEQLFRARSQFNQYEHLQALGPEDVADLIDRYRFLGPNEPNEPNEPAVAFEPNEPVQEELSAIEKLLAGETPGADEQVLTQFGYDVFRQRVSTFAPVTNVPVGPDYIVGPGDVFTVTLWGRANAQYTILVDRNGQITLPELGVLRVGQMTFSRLVEYLEHSFSRKHTDFKIAVTMDRLRSVSVFVVGEARTPGSFTLSSLSTAVHAVFAAGGPSKNGSLRKVRLLRAGREPVTVDLYDFLLGGDVSADTRLHDGDTIFIPLIGPVVAVAGNVKRPAIYEMTEPLTLSQSLDLAGGVTFAGWLQRVQVERIENHQRRVVVDFDISKDTASGAESVSETVLQDGDLVTVLPVVGPQRNVVYLEGHVIRPGKVQLKVGMRLRDVIGSYEILLPQADLDHGQIERLAGDDLHPIVVPFNLRDLLAGDDSQNHELIELDTIRVFRWDELDVHLVRVTGLVHRPGAYRLVPGMTLRGLIDTAGGLAKNAYVETAELTRRHIGQDGVTEEKLDIDLARALAGAPEHDVALQDYDHVVVRPVPDLDFERSVEVTGEVKFPGTYPIQRGETLSSLLIRAGGFTQRAYLPGAVFTRRSAKLVQQERMDRLIQELEESVLSHADTAFSSALDAESVASQKAMLQSQKELIAKLRTARAQGRVVIRLLEPDRLAGSMYDVELENGDVLNVPRVPGIVHVLGEVVNPTALLFETDKNVRYYLTRAGGPTPEAYKEQLSVIKADGSVVTMGQGGRRTLAWDSDRHRWVAGSFWNMTLEPGDAIIVPRDIGKVPWLKTTKDITQIIFQIALATGVVLAL